MSRTENGFSSEHAKLPEFLENPTVKDMVPGDVFGVEEDELMIGTDRKCWLNGDAQFSATFDGWEDELTVVRINEGYVIDLSDEERKEARFSISTASEIIAEAGENLVPVIGFIVSYKDLLDFDKQYREQVGKRYLTKELRKQVKKKLKTGRAASKVAINSDRS